MAGGHEPSGRVRSGMHTPLTINMNTENLIYVSLFVSAIIVVPLTITLPILWLPAVVPVSKGVIAAKLVSSSCVMGLIGQASKTGSILPYDDN